MKSERTDLRFFLTPEHPCSYLHDRQAKTLFLDPRETITADLYSRLSNLGFRRSGSHLYRPQCGGCAACIPTRIPVTQFAPDRSQRRTARRNRDLRFDVTEAVFSPAAYVLYERYIAGRHRDGDMYPASEDQFRSFLLSPWSSTWFLCAWLDNRLVAVGVFDRLGNGLSAVYTFFDPGLDSRSLGTQMILEEINLCRALQLPYLYLGYWIRDSEKMQYKTRFRPVQLLVNGRWVDLP
ncbi:MAG: arginyltransferase [Pseudomonadales bacterium]|nr:arginyltransferase [Pseudomonadales bacterium]MCP5185742.1 arginyltransferase [Pseudomonadales bacterium]